VVREKLKGEAIERRVHGTAGGDRITFPCSVSSSTASLTCFKMLLNGIVSSDSFFGSADATGFYLGADLPDPQSLKIYCGTFDAVVAGLGLFGQKNAIAATTPIATAFKFGARYRKNGLLNRLQIKSNTGIIRRLANQNHRG
jgi:hypothetical protein